VRALARLPRRVDIIVCSTLLALALCCDSSSAQPEKVKIEVPFATEHVPDGVKVGVKVDLTYVVSKTTAAGRTNYRTAPVVPDVEVAAITKVEKPTTPEEAVKVEFLVAKEQADKIKMFKEKLVERIETQPGQAPVNVKKPLTFRIEVPKPKEKK
jgi:hypothetical protein